MQKFLTLKIIGLLSIVIFIASIGFLIEDEPIKESMNKDDPLVLQLPDFPNSKEGTFAGTLQKEYFKQPIDQIVILFASARVPGLALLYYPYEKKLVAGSPQMVAENIIFFDGTHHRVAYAFKEGEDQYLIYDDKIVARSPFNPPDNNQITGMVIGAGELVVSESFTEVGFN
jgi:hypothetical protein